MIHGEGDDLHVKETSLFTKYCFKQITDSFSSTPLLTRTI